jgi:hypothetical protein
LQQGVTTLWHVQHTHTGSVTVELHPRPWRPQQQHPHLLPPLLPSQHLLVLPPHLPLLLLLPQPPALPLLLSLLLTPQLHPALLHSVLLPSPL